MLSGCMSIEGMNADLARLDHAWELDNKLAIAQRANKKDLVKNIHLKIKNKRKDELHKLTSNLVKDNQAIFMGNISAAINTLVRWHAHLAGGILTLQGGEDVNNSYSINPINRNIYDF